MNRRRYIIIVGLIVAISIAMAYLSSVNWIDRGETHNIENLYVLVASVLVTVTGVTATGYIFLSESIRKMRDDNEEYSKIAEEFHNHIYKNLLILLVLGSIIVMSCVFVLMRYDDNLGIADNIRIYARMFLVAFSASVFWCSILLITRMVNIYSELKIFAEKSLDLKKKSLNNTPLVIRMDAKESEDLVSWKGMEGLTYDPVTSPDTTDKVIIGIRAGDDESGDDYKMYVLNNKIATRDMCDEFDSQNVLRIFGDVEYILCRIANIPSGRITDLDRNILLSALGSNRDYTMENGLAEDIVYKYYLLRDYRDYYTVVADTESNPEKIPRPDPLTGFRRTGEVPAYDIDAGKNKRSRASKPTDMEYIQAIVPHIFVLRFELLKKLEDRTLTDMSLIQFDFSYAKLNGSNLSNSVLNKASFYYADMRGTNLSGCELNNTDFREADCSSIVLDHAIMHASSTDNAVFNYCNMTSIMLSETKFNDCSLVNSALEGAHINVCTFQDCNISGSNSRAVRMSKCKIGASGFTNTDFRHCTLSECTVSGSDFSASTFSESTINNTTISESLFIGVKLDRSDMMSLVLMDDDFSNSMLNSTNMTGSNLIDVRMESSLMSDCNFTKTVIGSKTPLADRSKIPVSKSIKDIQRRTELELEYVESRIGDKNRDAHPKHPSDALLDVKSNYDYAVMTRSVFIDTEMFDTTFRYAVLSDSVFNGTTISNCLFENASFSKALLADVTVDDTNMSNSDFDNANFTNVVIRGCTLDGCLFNSRLVGMTFEECSMEETMFSDCTLYRCTFRNIKGLEPHMFKNCNIQKVELNSCSASSGIPIRDGTYSGKELENAIQRASEI